MEQIQKYDHYRRGVNMAIQYLSYKNVLRRSSAIPRKMKFLKMQLSK